MVKGTRHKFDSGGLHPGGPWGSGGAGQRRSSFLVPGPPVQLHRHGPRRAEPLSLFCTPPTGQALHGAERGTQLQPRLRSRPCPPAAVWCPGGAAQEHHTFSGKLLEEGLFQSTATHQGRSLVGTILCVLTIRRAGTVDTEAGGWGSLPRPQEEVESRIGDGL